jgi:hypothetical protein
MWRHIAQSVQGPGHAAEGLPCQDNHRVRTFGAGEAATLVACVADGAGSAPYSDIGSGIACDAIIEQAAAYFESSNGFNSLQLGDARCWCENARSRIRDVAIQRQAEPRAFATTLCVAIAGPEFSVFFQIGDGAIILGNNGVYGIVFWPQSGEYANSTNFLTAEEYEQQLEFFSVPGQCDDIALMTDGLERLALRFDSRTPHAPFFVPLFRALRSTENVEGLSEELGKFLGSDSIRTRSDDDKTLILASR